MAKFFPDIPPDFNKSEAEYKLYLDLKRGLSDDWCVLHSVYVHQHDYKRSGEADFVLLSHQAIIVIEVKGGEVYAEDGGWCFKNRHGDVSRKKESPYQQAESAWHALKKIACERPGAGELIKKVAHGWGCYFPDCEIPLDLVPANIWPKEMICDASRLSQATASEIILEMAAYVIKKDRELAVRNKREVPSGLNDLEYSILIDCFRPNFNAVPSMMSSIQSAERQLVRLTSEQGDALWGMEGVQRLLVHGPAGTGKTLIAETRYHSLLSQDDSNRVALLCFNVHLADHLSSLNMLKTKPGRSFIGTIHSLLREYSSAIKVNPGDHDGCLRDLLNWRSANPDGAFDNFIIDEGQDMLAQPKLCEALGCLLKGGWTKGEWVWFEDRGQSLVRYTENVFNPPAQVTYRLKRNVRNSLHIAEFANKSTSNPAVPSDIPGHQVKSLSYKSSEEAGRFEELTSVVVDLIRKGFKPEDIVLLDYSDSNEILAKLKMIGGLAASNWTTSPRRSVVRYTTVRKFKGMEAPAVVVYNVRGKIIKDDPLFYVASTRSKVSLTILCDPDSLLSITEMLVN